MASPWRATGRNFDLKPMAAPEGDQDLSGAVDARLVGGAGIDVHELLKQLRHRLGLAGQPVPHRFRIRHRPAPCTLPQIMHNFCLMEHKFHFMGFIMSILAAAAQVFRCFRHDCVSLTLTDLVAMSGMPKSNASRLLRSMRDAGLLETIG